ncbi:helix-turn-helix domain-containing protein [Listeria costaricensis]|uniref:helix-turn-helix domain-containing protein n=1 Tax=Listeria costaricensis TaxID=2026604 RepID=UPI000C08B48E|nr:helix-turn-helix domain-containing protein [Listeria costaricensis]
MRSLLEKSVRRRMELLEILIENNEWVKLETLAEKLNCSKRTLNNDIAIIQKELQDNWELDTSRKWGIRLVIPETSQLDQLYQFFMKKSTSVQLLLGTFYDQQLTVEEWADKLFISPSSLYRLIHRVKSRLQIYGVDLSINPVAIVGPEQQVRYFYMQLFWSGYGPGEWPFQTDDRAQIDQFMRINEEATGFQFIFPYRSERYFWLHVGLERIRQGYLMEGLQINERILDEPRLHKGFAELEQMTGLQIEKWDRLCMKLMQLQGVTFRDKHAIDQSMAYYERVLPEIVALADPFLEKVIAEYGWAPENEDQVRWQLFQYFNYCQHFLEIDGFIVEKRGYVARQLRKEFGRFCSAIEAAAEASDFGKLRISIDTLIFLLGTLWQGLIDERQLEHPPIRTLVTSQLSVSNTAFLTNMIKSRFQSQVEIVEMNENQLNVEVLLAYNVELVISDWAIDTNGLIPIIEINYYPNDRDWRNIRKMVQRAR